MNVAVARGHVLAAPNERRLGSGEYATAFDVVTESDAGRLTVPVNWVTTVKTLIAEGDDVVVIGRVRRRFFQAGGVVQSRTELLAESVIAARVNRTENLRDLLRQMALPPLLFLLSFGEQRFAEVQSPIAT